MPRKVFTAGEILTAADVNTNLMDQSVMVFAGTAARGSAIPSPTEGMVTYREDDDTVEVYDGSSWNPVGPGQILQVVSAETATQTNTTSTSFVNTAASVSITPSSTSSKVLVLSYSGLFQIGGNTGALLNISRDTTEIGQSSNLFVGASIITPAFLQVLDSPATTSSVTYRTRLRTQNASFTASAAKHVMVAMEVAG